MSGIWSAIWQNKAVIKSTVGMGSSVPGRVARSNSVEEFHDHSNTAAASHYLVCKQLTPLVTMLAIRKQVSGASIHFWKASRSWALTKKPQRFSDGSVAGCERLA